MGTYVVSAKSEQQAMAEEIGLTKAQEVFSQIPEEVRYQGTWKYSKGLSEMETSAYLRELAGKNQIFPHIFFGEREHTPIIFRLLWTVW